MPSEETDIYIVASSIAHKQALFEADLYRRQRNGLIAGSILTPLISGALQGADVINDTVAWGPRFLSGLLVVGGVFKFTEAREARNRASSIAQQVAEHVDGAVLPSRYPSD